MYFGLLCFHALGCILKAEKRNVVEMFNIQDKSHMIKLKGHRAMQQVSHKQEARLSAWAYFLGMGFAIGAGSIGTLLSVLLHNPGLGYSVGVVVGLLLGLLGLKFFGPAWVKRIETNLARKGRQQKIRKPLPFGFFIGEGAALGLGGVGLPLGLFIQNIVLGLSIGLATGLIAGIIVGQLVRLNRNRTL